MSIIVAFLFVVSTMQLVMMVHGSNNEVAVESTESEVPLSIDNDTAPAAVAAPTRTVGIRSSAMRGPLPRHLWCSACECVADLQLSVFVQEPRQRVQLGSRLDDNNKYKYVDFWPSQVGANEAIERVCEALQSSESKHPFRLIRSASGEHEWIAGAKETHPANATVAEFARIKHQLSEWCIFVTEDLEDNFVRGFIAGVQKKDFRAELCVKELRACTELAPAAAKDEL
jgi:hypothetical protein